MIIAAKTSLLAAVALLALASSAFANGRLVARGRAIANLNCARCHAVRAADESPNPKSPPFRALAKRYDPRGLEEALAEGIVVGHQGLEMPHFQMTPDQIEAFLAYLRSLREK